MTEHYPQFCRLTLEEFMNNADDIQCKVITVETSLFHSNKYVTKVMLNKMPVICIRKSYDDFYGLYNLIESKYKSQKLDKFPRKFHIFNNGESRKSYFQKMLNNILIEHPESSEDNILHDPNRRRLLAIVYMFLTSGIEKEGKQDYSSSLKKFDRIVNQGKSVLRSQVLEVRSEIDPKEVLEELHYQQSTQIRESQNNKTDDHHLLMRPRSFSYENHFSKQRLHTKTQGNEFQVKFANELQWKKRYIEIKDSVLYLYINKKDKYFKTAIELYRITAEFLKRDMNIFDHFCEKMEIDLTRTFNENKNILSIYHQYDCEKILIRKPLQLVENHIKNHQQLQRLKETIIAASYKSPLHPEMDGVFNPIGKIFIYIHKLKFKGIRKQDQQEQIKVRIKAGVMRYETKTKLKSKQVVLNQGFLIPISNTFQQIRIQCLSSKNDSWLSSGSEFSSTIGQFSFNMMEFIMKPHRSLISKLQAALQNTSVKDTLRPHIQISIQNMSSISSMYSNSIFNQNDGTPIYPIQSLDQLTDLSIVIDRLLRMIGSVCLFLQAFWRNVYCFKYPKIGYIFFAFLIYNVFFLDTSEILRQVLAMIMLGVIYQQRTVKSVVDSLMDSFFFRHIHPNFKKPKLLSTKEANYLIWSHAFQYIYEDCQMVNGRLVTKPDTQRKIFEFIVHDQLFTITQDDKSLFEKIKQGKKIVEGVRTSITNLVMVLEKVVNLLSWVDQKKTILIVVLLFLSTSFASGALIRVGLLFFSINRLRKGKNFYAKKHYEKNRKLAVYCLRYILHKSFPEIIGDKSVDRDMDFVQLNQYLSNLNFPIYDEQAQKKLKSELDGIMGVYFEPQLFYSKSLKNKNVKMVHILDAIESCQSRLKLKSVAGEEGISNDFQQLKQQTRSVPVIDIWIEETVKNFILNTPSQVFMLFNRQKLHKIEKIERKNARLQRQLSSKSKKSLKDKENEMPNLFSEEQKLIQNKKRQLKEIQRLQKNLPEEQTTRQSIALSKRKSQ